MKSKINLILIFILVALISLPIIHYIVSNPKYLPLNSNEWGKYNGHNDPKRYNMTLWLFKTNWFENKTEKDILEQLPDNDNKGIIDNKIRFNVRFINPNFFIGIDPLEIRGILIIYFDDGIVVRAEYHERKDKHSDYTVKIVWDQ